MGTSFWSVELAHIGPGLVAQLDEHVGDAIARVQTRQVDKVAISLSIEVGWDKDGIVAAKAASKHNVTRQAVWYPPMPVQQEADFSEGAATADEQPELPAMGEYVAPAPEPLALGPGEEIIDAEFTPDPAAVPLVVCGTCDTALSTALAKHIARMTDPGEGQAVFVKQEGSVVTECSYPLKQAESEVFNAAGRGVLVTADDVTCPACLEAAHARKGQAEAA